MSTPASTKYHHFQLLALERPPLRSGRDANAGSGGGSRRRRGCRSAESCRGRGGRRRGWGGSQRLRDDGVGSGSAVRVANRASHRVRHAAVDGFDLERIALAAGALDFYRYHKGIVVLLVNDTS